MVNGKFPSGVDRHRKALDPAGAMNQRQRTKYPSHADIEADSTQTAIVQIFINLVAHSPGAANRNFKARC
jgi:hypothetical protein